MKVKTTHFHKYQGKTPHQKEVRGTLKNNTPRMQGWLTIRVPTTINHFTKRSKEKNTFITICIIVPQKTKPKRYIQIEIYCKKLAHTIMVAEKSQDLQLASWRPRKPEV